MRWRLLGLLFFAAAGAVAWTFWWRPEAESWLKVQLESRVSRALGQELRLDAVRLHPLLLRVTLVRPRLGPVDRPLFRCERWTFRTSVAGGGSPLSLTFLTLGRSTVDRPVLHLPPWSGRPFSLPAGWWRRLPLHHLAWKDGTFTLPTTVNQPDLVLREVDGSLQLSPQGFLGIVDATSPAGPFRLSLSGVESILPGSQFGVRARLRFDRAHLDALAPWVPRSWGEFQGIAEVSLDAGMKAFSLDLLRNDPSFESVQWAADAQLEDVLWRPPSARPKDVGIPLQGRVSAKNGRVELDRLRLFRSLEASGSIEGGDAGAFDLSWRGQDLAMVDLAESGLAVFRAIPLRGRFDTDGSLVGDRRRPDLQWTFQLRDAGFPGLFLPTVAGRGQWKEDWFSLVSDVMSGQVEIAGTLRASESGAAQPGGIWMARALNLDLSQMAKRNAWPRVGGLLNASFSLVHPSSGSHVKLLEATGRLRIDDLAWGVHQATAPVQGHLTLDSLGLRVIGARQGFYLDVRRTSDVWRVERFVYHAGPFRAWGDGFLRDGQGNFQLDGGLEGLSLAHLPMVTKQFPNIQGTVSAQGRLHGRWEDPIFTGTVRLPEMRWRPGGLGHRGEAELRGGKEGLLVSRFLWDDVLRAEGSWLFRRGWKVSAQLEETHAEQVFDFIAGSAPVSGRISGSVSLAAGERPGLEGWVQAAGVEGRWGPLPFRDARTMVFFRGEHVIAESIEIRQTSGTLRVQGEAHRHPVSAAVPRVAWDWQLDGEADRIAVNAAVVSGTWTARGVYRPRTASGEGELASPHVVLGVGFNGAEPRVALDGGAVHARFAWAPGLWRLEELTSERGLRTVLQGEGESGILSGRTEVRDLSAAALCPAVFNSKDFRAGQWDGDFVWSGTASDPRAEGRVTLREAGWLHVGATGEFNVQWAGPVTLSKSLLRFADGGELRLSGAWDPAGEEAFRFEGILDRLSLAPFMRSGGVPVPWTGVANGHLSLAGSPTGSTGTLRLEGEARAPEPGSALVQWTTRFHLKGWRATVEEALFTTAEGRWRVEADSALAFAPGGGFQFHLNNELRNIRVGPLQLFGGLTFDGEASLSDRSVEGQAGARGLWINQRVFDQDLARVRWSPGVADFTRIPGAKAFVEGRVLLDRWPQTSFENLTFWGSGKRLAVLTGEMGPTHWDFSLQGWGLQADSLISLADFDWPVTGPWNVQVRGKGSPESPDVTAMVSGGPGQVGPVPYDKVEANVEWRGKGVDVRGARLTRKKGYLLTGEGHFPAREGEELDPSVYLNLRLTDGKLAILEEAWPLCKAAGGSFSGNLRLESKSGISQAIGSFQIRDGRLALRSYVPRLTDLNVQVVLDGERARIESARAKVGRGWVEMAGDIGLRGLSPVDLDVALQSDGRRGMAVEVPQLSVPPGPLLGRFSFLSDRLKGVSFGEPWVSLRMKGPFGQHTISGEVKLDNTYFTFPPSKKGGGGLRGPRWWQDLWRLARWDLLLKTGEETWYRNEYVNVHLEGNLKLAGHPNAWAADGRVETREGQISYLGQVFQVQQGVFEVLTDTRSAVGMLPYVSGEAERVVTSLDARGFSSDDTVSMVIDRSLLGEMKPRFVSRNNPDMNSDRVAMRALGITGQQVTQEDRDQLLRAGLVQLVGSSAAPFANRLAQKFGIGMISAIYEAPEMSETVPTEASPVPTAQSPETTSPVSEYLRGAGAAARIRLTERLFGVYKVKLDEVQNQVFFRDQIELVYRVVGSLHVRASTELDSENRLGQPPERRASLENQWRFGLPRSPRKRQSPEPVK